MNNNENKKNKNRNKNVCPKKRTIIDNKTKKIIKTLKIITETLITLRTLKTFQKMKVTNLFSLNLIVFSNRKDYIKISKMNFLSKII